MFIMAKKTFLAFCSAFLFMAITYGKKPSIPDLIFNWKDFNCSQEENFEALKNYT